jgi:L-fuculose-phosphate aldolase
MRLEPTPETIVYIGKLMFESGLTDIAGGNVSCRDGDQLYITPTGAGQQWHWRLKPEEILTAPVATDELLDNPAHSHESISHLLIYRAFPYVTAVLHAHPIHVLPFCAAGQPIPAVIKSAQVYGEAFTFIQDTPAYSREQGEQLVSALGAQETSMREFAGVALVPQHGIFVAAPDMHRAIDCLERMNTNAWCNIARGLIA